MGRTRQESCSPFMTITIILERRQEIINGYAGILLFGDATENMIGGTTPAQRNVISGWGGESIDLEPIGAIEPIDIPPTGNVIAGNYLGCDASGTEVLAVEQNNSGVVIFGTNNTVVDNVISGNLNVGVSIGALGTTNGTEFAGGYEFSGNTVQGNFIGVQADGNDPLPNGGDGIVIGDLNALLHEPRRNQVLNNLIGGTTPRAANIIAFNGGAGVQVGLTTGDTETTGNSIVGNSIYSNGALGIDLAGDSVTLNDSEPHLGPNYFQNFPILKTVSSSSTNTSIAGTFSEAAGNQYDADTGLLRQSDR